MVYWCHGLGIVAQWCPSRDRFNSGTSFQTRLHQAVFTGAVGSRREGGRDVGLVGAHFETGADGRPRKEYEHATMSMRGALLGRTSGAPRLYI